MTDRIRKSDLQTGGEGGGDRISREERRTRERERERAGLLPAYRFMPVWRLAFPLMSNPRGSI